MTAGQPGPTTDASRPRPRPASALVAERAEHTRNALVAAARQLFVERGYHATSTEEIVALADVTRGALYHHFTDKRALFAAVLEAVEADLVATASATVQDGPPLDMLRDGLLGFLDGSLTPDVQRILLIDGPAVLGWQEWRAIEERYGLGGIQAMLERAVAEGSLSPQPLELLAHLLLATADEAALYIVNADDPATARAQAVHALRRLLDALAAS
jgi:AcrR family transcriptional regulator